VPPGSHATIRKTVAKFVAEQGGNVAAIFAIACIPVIAAMGVAVDYTRGSQASSSMQDALDAATLAPSRRSDLSTLTQPEIQQFAEDYFNANFHNTEIKDLALQASYVATGPSVAISASGNLPTDFMGVLGKEFMAIGHSSTAVWGEARLRVALALDNTGSMASSSKLTALKTATHNLLTQLQTAATTDGDVYVSIVPFVKDVNVGSASYDQGWVKWNGSATKDRDLWDKQNGTCSGGSYASYYHNETDCLSHGYTWTPLAHSSTWNGCIMDRDQSYDTLNTAPTTTDTATLFPAEQYAYCPVSLMGLTYDWTALNNKVDAMVANGSTNQAIGLQWAWQSLTASPFTIPAMDPSRIYKQAIILLSDGLNTQDRWYGNGSSTSSQVDARQQILCANIKAAGVILYTVQVNTGGDPTSTLLQNCASSSDKFFLLTSSDQIVTTFQQIGTELSELRISK
jgi:Flp pilus assembly protein TadG